MYALILSIFALQALAASLLQLEMLQDTTQRLIEIMNEQSQISPTPDVS